MWSSKFEIQVENRWIKVLKTHDIKMLKPKLKTNVQCLWHWRPPKLQEQNNRSNLYYYNNKKKTPKWKDELSTTIESKFCRSRIDQGVFFNVEVDCVKVEIKVECVKPKSNLRSTT